VRHPLPPRRDGHAADTALLARRSASPPNGDLASRDQVIAGVACQTVGEPAANGAVVLHLHGGGYRLGSAKDWIAFGSRLAAAADAPVILPDYALAPEFPFPHAVHDVVGILTELSARPDVGPIVLSGDCAATVAAVAAAVGITDARGDLSPDGKRAAIAALQAGGAVVAMVGDGVNDAPALAQAQVSISLASAAPLAQWTADVVVLAPALMPIADALAHAKRTLAIIRQNLLWAAVYNLVAIPAAAFGLVTPLAAAAGMSLSSLAVVANALRATRWTSSSS